MPLWIFTAVYGLAIVVALATGIWLLLHLTAVARTFAGKVDIVPSPKPARASGRTVRRVLAAFGAGLGLAMAIQILALTGVANAWIG
jgi:hypothetical protein